MSTVQNATEVGTGAPRGFGPRRRIVVVALGALVALLAAVACVLAAMLLMRGNDQQVRDEVLASASGEVESLLSYDSKNLDAAGSVVDQTTTGAFRDDYKRLFDETVRPNAERVEAGTLAKVVGAGWIGSRGDDATVLVFVNQSTRTTQGERVDTVQAEVTMREVDGRWLIAGLDQA